MEVLFLILLFILGACFGSFLCCQVRRLHHDTKKGSKSLGSRSVCLHCHYQLKWYDNIPLFSWLFLRGKCRKCHTKIGNAEILSELLLALSWLALGTTLNPLSSDPLAWATFLTTLVFSLPLAFLAIYDGLYGELPVRYLTISVLCAIIILALKEWALFASSAFSPELIWKPLLSVLILGGLYLLLYGLSHGKWVGDGDWLLGLALGLALYDPWLALITLFVTNFLACLVALPRLKKTQKIYLGPFMVLAFIVVTTFANFLTNLI